MSKLNLFSYLPSPSTTMRSLSYPVHLIIKFGIILYNNELPGRQRNVRAQICEDAEAMPRSSIPNPAVLDSVKAGPPEVIALEHVASVEEATNSDHVLLGRAFACGKYIIIERSPIVGLSTQDSGTGISSDGPLSETRTGKKSTVEASTQTDEDIVSDNVSSGSQLSPTTLINTPTGNASAVSLEEHERQEETVDEAQETEEVGPTASTEETLSTQKAAYRQTREELATLKEQIATRDTQIETLDANYLRLERQSNESRQELEVERDDLREQLEEAGERIVELEDAADEEHVRRLESQVEDLQAVNTQLWGKINDQQNVIQVGYKELSTYIRVGTKLHARLNQVDGILKDSRWTASPLRAELGSADRLMRSAKRWFPIAVPVREQLREIQLAIEGPPAIFSDLPNLETLSSDTPESTLVESGFTFAFGMPAQESRQETESTAKKSVLEFSGTPARDSRPKVKCRAKEPAIQFDFSPSGVMPRFGGMNNNPAVTSTALSDSTADFIGGEDKQVQQLTGAKTPCTSGEAPSTPEGRVEVEAPNVLGKPGFDVAALTRIVNSVVAAVPEKIGVVDTLEGLGLRAKNDKLDPRNWRSSGMTIAEVTARWTTEYRERAEPPAALMLWRKAEWPAALPPLKDLESEWSAESSPLATHQAPTSSQAPRSGLVALEEGIRDVMGAIEGLHLGPAAPPAISQAVDAGKYILSGDWVVRPSTSTLQQVDASSREPEAIMESEPRETDSATTSNGPQERPPMRPQPATQPAPEPAPQQAPQPRPQVEDAAKSSPQAPDSTAKSGGESQEQSKDPTPKKPSGGYRIWSLRKPR